MATLQVLGSAYADVARIKFSDIPAADLAKLQALANQIDVSAISLTDARIEIGKMANASTSVANLAYAFFTGVTPKMVGLDYLVSPNGGNPNNLNSAYYTSFTAENRYINFSVNLGKTGEGQARFTAGYGALDLAGAATKAYAEIFGFAPAAGKIDAILNSFVANGKGGTYTRAEYFASYGGDGLNGQGTKAAMIGWLLSEATKADLGAYAKANDAFLADLAADGQATFNTDLLAAYGQQPIFGTGATIAAPPSQGVSPDAASVSLRSTGNNDIVTGADSNAAILTGGGHDTVTFSGALGGYVDGGDGNDTISVGTLNAYVPVLGGAPNGTILGGAGNDLITISKAINGAVIDGGAGDDTLVIGADTDLFDRTQITNVEHLVLNNFKIGFLGQSSGFNAQSYIGLQDITFRSADSVFVEHVADSVALKLDGVTGGAFQARYDTHLEFYGMSSVRVGATAAHLYLNNVKNTGATPTSVTITGNDGPLYVHVQSDSVLDAIKSNRAISDSEYSPVVVTGVGRVTAAFETTVLDASGASSIVVTRFGYVPTGAATAAILSSGDDTIFADLRGGAFQTYVLGAGSDTFGLYQNHFANLRVSSGIVEAFATITDFAKGVDHVNLGAGVTAVVGNIDIGAPTSLEQALIAASAQVAANGTGVFEYKGDTYIYHQDATAGANTGDGLIKLVGVTGLSIGTGAAPADIHYG